MLRRIFGKARGSVRIPPEPAVRYCVVPTGGAQEQWRLLQPNIRGTQIGEYNSEEDAIERAVEAARSQERGAIIEVCNENRDLISFRIVHREGDTRAILCSYPIAGGISYACVITATVLASIFLQIDEDFLKPYVGAVLIGVSLMVTAGFGVLAAVTMDRRTHWVLQANAAAKSIAMIIMSLITFFSTICYLLPWKLAKIISGFFVIGSAIVTVSGVGALAIALLHYMRDSREHRDHPI